MKVIHRLQAFFYTDKCVARSHCHSRASCRYDRWRPCCSPVRSSSHRPTTYRLSSLSGLQPRENKCPCPFLQLSLSGAVKLRVRSNHWPIFIHFVSIHRRWAHISHKHVTVARDDTGPFNALLCGAALRCHNTVELRKKCCDNSRPAGPGLMARVQRIDFALDLCRRSKHALHTVGLQHAQAGRRLAGDIARIFWCTLI